MCCGPPASGGIPLLSDFDGCILGSRRFVSGGFAIFDLSLTFISRNNARFLWKRAPSEAKKGTELAAVWEVGKALWKKEHAAFFRAVNSASWSAEVGLLIQRLTGIQLFSFWLFLFRSRGASEETRSRMLEHVPRTYTSIRVSEFADLIGESADAAAACTFQIYYSVVLFVTLFPVCSGQQAWLDRGRQDDCACGRNRVECAQDGPEAAAAAYGVCR